MTASNNDISKGRNVILGPREFMRARHPDLFSDTQVSDVRRFPRAVFEYHLDTVTSRKQEYQFEHFCRKLAEREICPNLRVQTGPTGGGDSKVDAETYPVADEIAERWWIGSAAAGTERWAFAFSAKKKWKPKVKADVDSILSTNRNYRRIYFFTNQFVSDKARSQQEDELSRYAGIPVHIMDRAWIVEKVYENGHVELAVAALGIEDVRGDKVNRAGPEIQNDRQNLRNWTGRLRTRPAIRMRNTNLRKIACEVRFWRGDSSVRGVKWRADLRWPTSAH